MVVQFCQRDLISDHFPIGPWERGTYSAHRHAAFPALAHKIQSTLSALAIIREVAVGVTQGCALPVEVVDTGASAVSQGVISVDGFLAVDAVQGGLDQAALALDECLVD